MNINSLNYRLNDDSIKNVSININSNKNEEETKTVDSLFSSVGVSGLGATTSTESVASTAKSLMQDADDVLDQLKTSAEAAKGSLNALFKRLSGADCVELDEDGYGLNDTEPEKIVTVVERIKIMLAAYCDDYQMTGSDVSLDEIKQVVGSTSMAVQVEGKLNDADLPSDEDNVSDVMTALGKVDGIGDISQGTRDYLVKNEIEPTIDNLYNSQYQSGSANPNAKSMGEDEWQQLEPQVEKAILAAGLSVGDDTLAMARHMLDNDIDLTSENLAYMNGLEGLDMGYYKTQEGRDELLDLIVDTMSDGGSAGSTSLMGRQSDISLVADAIRTVNQAGEANVSDVLEHGGELTIKSLRESMEHATTENVDNAIKNTDNATANTGDAMSLEQIQGMKSLVEIQILMTADAGLNLVRQGFDIDVMPLAKLADNLRQMELDWIGGELATWDEAGAGSALADVGNADNAASTVAELIYRSQRALRDIANAPDDVIGELALENEYVEKVTIGEFASFGSSLGEQYRRAGRTYEAVGTQVRADLGDSVGKALKESTEGILSDMGLEDTQANRDAVRIIASTGLELTQANIARVKAAYSTLNSLMDNMEPSSVLSMIRDGINPMDSGIGDVNEYLKSLKESGDEQDKAEKFSKFLYKLDRTKGINEDEREQFIGIYKMMNIFRKDAGKAVGQLIASGRELTMSNLVSAYESRRAAGIDRTVDETTGMAEVTGTVNYYDSIFARNANKITPLSLKDVNDEKAIDDRGVEEFVEAVGEAYDPAAEAEYYGEYLREMKSAVQDADMYVLRELARFEEPVTINRIQAMGLIANGEGFGWKQRDLGLFGDVLDEDDDLAETALNDAYEEAAVDSDRELGTVTEQGGDYDSLRAARLANSQIHLLADMAKKHDYRIPVEVDGEVRTMHLQLVEDKDNAGRIAIDMETDSLGSIHVEARVGDDAIRVFALSDKDGDGLMERLQASLDGEDGVSVNVGRSDALPRTDLPVSSAHIGTTRLYSIAKRLVVGLA